MSELVKLKREYSLSPIEFIKYQLNQAINIPAPKLNETDITILAYVHHYKDKAKDKVLEDRILTSPNSYINYVSKLKGMGYITKEEKTNPKSPAVPIINPLLRLEEEDFITLVIVRKDPNKNEVYHPYYKQ